MKPSSTHIGAVHRCVADDAHRIGEVRSSYSALRPASAASIEPACKPSEFGVIPGDWQIRSLREVAQVQSGIAKNSKRQVRNAIDVHYLRVANVQDGYLDLGQMSTIRLSRDELVRYAVLPGDVLMNEGGDLDQLGRGAMWRGEFDPCVHQNHVFVVRCRPGLLPEFLNAWTASTPARRYFLLAGKQTTNLASINKTALGELPVLMPGPEEQSAIAEALSDVDGLLRALDALIAKKRAIKQAAMQQLLTGNTRLPGFGMAWATRRLGDLASVKRGASPRPIDSPIWFDQRGTAGWVRISDLTRSGMYLLETTQKLSPLGVQNSHQVPAGSLIMSICATVGRPIITAIDVCIHDGFVVFEDISLDLRFAFYLLSHIEPDWAKHGQTGSQMNLNTALINDALVRVPPHEEQVAIAGVLSDMEREIDHLQLRREKTRAIKQGMMQQLLTGRVRLVSPPTATTEGAA